MRLRTPPILVSLALALAAPAVAASLTSDSRPIVSGRTMELLDLAGGGFEIIRRAAEDVGKQLQALGNLDLVELDDLVRLREEIEGHEEALRDLHARILSACNDYDEAQRGLENILADIGAQALRLYEEAERAPGDEEVAGVEAWLQESNANVDALANELRNAERGVIAQAALKRLQGVLEDLRQRADAMEKRRLEIERQLLVAEVEERLPVLRGLLEEKDLADAEARLDDDCKTGVANLERLVEAFGEAAGETVVVRARIGKELLDSAGAPQRCLAELFFAAASERRSELEALLEGADDGTEDFQKLRGAYDVAVKAHDMELDPLAAMRAFQGVEYSVFRYLRGRSDDLEVELRSLGAQAGRHEAFEETLNEMQSSLKELVESLTGDGADMVAISRGLQDLASQSSDLEKEVQTRLERAAAVKARDKAMAMEQRFNELYYEGSLRPSEEDLYHRAVKMLGSGRVKFQAKDFSGAKASFEFAVEHFSRIRR